jgi:hypothetical protein
MNTRSPPWVSGLKCRVLKPAKISQNWIDRLALESIGVVDVTRKGNSVKQPSPDRRICRGTLLLVIRRQDSALLRKLEDPS